MKIIVAGLFVSLFKDENLGPHGSLLHLTSRKQWEGRRIAIIKICLTVNISDAN